MSVTTPTVMNADLVLEGGGVKGIGHVGAITALEEAGYTFTRVAGTSAGAIVASLVAANMTTAKMQQELRSVDYTKFRDPTDLSTMTLLGEGLSVLLEKGIYRGDYFHEWIKQQLDSQGVRTFGDLKVTTDPGSSLTPNQSYRLVVMTADLSRGELVRLPWDYPKYGRDPDTELVADAVRASMSIPFFFKPVTMKSSVNNADCWLVDGGALSNFPIGIFDRTDGQTPRWPTFGIKLSALPNANQVAHAITDTRTFAEALLSTMMNAHDQMHLNDPCVIARTIFVDTGNVQATDFGIDPATQQTLYQSGFTSAQYFLSQWQWNTYLQQCRSGQAVPAPATAAPAPG
jgi:NTE family protein